MSDDKQLYEEESFWQRVKESPRTVSALIIILIVAAAIYAFSGDDTSQPTDVAGTGDEGAAMNEVSGGDVEEGEEVAVMDSKPEEIELPPARQTNESYIEVANKGEGYTHLARKATDRWLGQNQATYEVTDEHRIYIEDYIQNSLGKEGLEIGVEVGVSFELVQEAVVVAGELDEAQINNLSQYTYVLQ